MARTSMFELSQQVESKQQQDRERIEKHTLNELRKHAQSLRDGLSDELDTTKAGISDRLREITDLIESLKTSTTSDSRSTRKQLKTDLDAIKTASSQNRKAAANSLKWGWLKYSLPALLVLLTICAGSWGLMRWQSSQLIQTQEQINQNKQTLKSLPGGVRFVNQQDGNFLIFQSEPELYRTQSGEWATKLKR